MTTFTIHRDTPTTPFHKHWQFAVGGGHAAMAMRTDYVAQLKRVHDDLGIQRIRFHGIFNDDMHTWDTLGNLLGTDQVPDLVENDFRLAGLVYDNVLSAGMKPFVELSFMPNALAKDDAYGTFYYKPNISLPKSYEQWSEYVTAFVTYLIHRYGKKEVETWFFEVWNEPDLPAVFFHGTQQDYFHLYEVTARAIKAVDQDLKVGGPATSSSRWIHDFTEFCSRNQVPFDFVSTHQYAGDPVSDITNPAAETEPSEEDVQARYTNMDFSALFTGLKPEEGTLPFYRRLLRDTTETDPGINRDILPHNASIVRSQAQERPVFYTEWNACALFSAYTNDTRKVAAYDVRTALAMDGIVEGSSIWCFSDIFEELHPFPEEFHGGFGLMTQHGIRKPVYHALRMLGEVGNERYTLPGALDGDISMAAFRNGSDIQVVLVRQNLQHEANEDATPLQATIRVETGSATRATRRRIDATSCNPLAMWESMGSPNDLRPDQIRELDAACEPEQDELAMTRDGSYAQVTTALGTNDIHFITIHLEE